MSGTVPGVDITLRPYRDNDESRVLELLTASLGAGPAGERPAEFFRWKHLESPFGPSFMLVAEDADRVVGLRAFMRWRFRVAGGVVNAVRAVDTATDPVYRGRGVFSRLTLDALDRIRDQVDFVFNTPNEKSLSGYLKMGWRIVGRIPVSVRVRRPLRFASQVHSARSAREPTSVPPAVAAPTAAEVLGGTGSLTRLLNAAGGSDALFSTPRDADYLRWRYAAAPLLDYRAVALEAAGRLRGLGIFRVRPRGALWEATIAEVIVAAGDGASAREVLREVIRSAPVDHLTCHFPRPSAQARAALRSGFARSPGGMTFVVNPLRDELRPDPTRIESWALSLGDLEVF